VSELSQRVAAAPGAVKTGTVLSVVLLAALAWGCQFGRRGDREPQALADLQFTELSDDVVVATSSPFAANSLLVRTADGTVILLDTPFTPHDTEALIEWARDRWGAYPAFAVNSHWHLDASGGNQVLLAHGAEVIASKRTTELLEQRGAKMKAGMLEYFAERDPSTRTELEQFQPTPASRVLEVGERTVVQLGGEEIWLIYPGPSHSVDSIGIYFPQRRLLYGGCAVRSDGKFINRDEADFTNWADAVERFAALEPLTVIPGHGIRFDPQMLTETIEGARSIAAESP